jgi:hypothetical protein
MLSPTLAVIDGGEKYMLSSAPTRTVEVAGLAVDDAALERVVVEGVGVVVTVTVSVAVGIWACAMFSVSTPVTIISVSVTKTMIREAVIGEKVPFQQAKRRNDESRNKRKDEVCGTASCKRRGTNNTMHAIYQVTSSPEATYGRWPL